MKALLLFKKLQYLYRDATQRKRIEMLLELFSFGLNDIQWILKDMSWHLWSQNMPNCHSIVFKLLQRHHSHRHMTARSCHRWKLLFLRTSLISIWISVCQLVGQQSIFFFIILMYVQRMLSQLWCWTKFLCCWLSRPANSCHSPAA